MSGRPLQRLQPDHIVVCPMLGAAEDLPLWPIPKTSRSSTRQAGRDASARSSGPSSSAAPPPEPDAEDEDPQHPDSEEEEAEEVSANAELLERCAAMDFLFAAEAKEAKPKGPRKRSHSLIAEAQPSNEERNTGGEEHAAGSRDSVLAVAEPAPEADAAASSSAANVDAAVPDPPAAGVRRAGTTRLGAMEAAAAFYMAGGRLSFHESKSAFEAVCNRHPNCNLSRTCKARKATGADGLPVGGRPCGFLAAWLSDDRWASKLEHKISRSSQEPQLGPEAGGT